MLIAERKIRIGKQNVGGADLKNAESPVVWKPLDLESWITEFNVSDQDANLCVFCDLTYDNEPTLDFHIKTVHKRLYVCSKCPHFMSMIKDKLTKHLIIVHKEAQIPLKTCLDGFPVKNRKYKIYECDHCWFSTRKEQAMKSHLNEKHLTNPPDRFMYSFDSQIFL